MQSAAQKLMEVTSSDQFTELFSQLVTRAGFKVHAAEPAPMQEAPEPTQVHAASVSRASSIPKQTAEPITPRQCNDDAVSPFMGQSSTGVDGSCAGHGSTVDEHSSWVTQGGTGTGITDVESFDDDIMDVDSAGLTAGIGAGLEGVADDVVGAAAAAAVGIMDVDVDGAGAAVGIGAGLQGVVGLEGVEDDVVGTAAGAVHRPHACEGLMLLIDALEALLLATAAQ